MLSAVTRNGTEDDERDGSKNLPVLLRAQRPSFPVEAVRMKRENEYTKGEHRSALSRFERLKRIKGTS